MLSFLHVYDCSLLSHIVNSLEVEAATGAAREEEEAASKRPREEEEDEEDDDDEEEEDEASPPPKAPKLDEAGAQPPPPMFFYPPPRFYYGYDPYSTQQQQRQQPFKKGIPLALQFDHEQLSDYQILVRQNLELFEASTEDVESNTQGRKKQVLLGQVGLRCRHCCALPLRVRGRGAVYYPSKLQGIYQAAQNMAGSHLGNACQQIPLPLKQELAQLRQRRDNASGGKKYWADGCKALGVYETEAGLRLGPRPGSEETEASNV